MLKIWIATVSKNFHADLSDNDCMSGPACVENKPSIIRREDSLLELYHDHAKDNESNKNMPSINPMNAGTGLKSQSSTGRK
jgi:hypothetical protein